MPSAIRKALEIYFLPSQVQHSRNAPLPGDILTLLEIIAGDVDMAQRAADAEERTLKEILESAEFFVEQILFAPDSDCYRVLGATPDMTTQEIRRHMALLSKWVHPDVRKSRDHASFAERISLAWDNLKTEDRRRSYDAGRQKTVHARTRPKKGLKHIDRGEKFRLSSSGPSIGGIAPAARRVGWFSQLLSRLRSSSTS